MKAFHVDVLSVGSLLIPFPFSPQEAHREEMLVNRLMRQSQQERRIAVQLMQVRMAILLA